MSHTTSAPSPFVTTAAIALAAVVTLAALASACGSTDHGARSTATTEFGPTTESSIGSTASSGSPSTAPDDNAAVLAAYQQFWQVWLRANNPPNPDYPDLVTVDEGSQLVGARQTISEHRAKDEVIMLPPDSHYTHQATATLDPHRSTATIVDCAIDDSLLKVIATGEVVNGDTTTQLIQAQMHLTDKRWKVTSLKFVQEWPGEAQCAVE